MRYAQVAVDSSAQSSAEAHTPSSAASNVARPASASGNEQRDPSAVIFTRIDEHTGKKHSDGYGGTSHDSRVNYVDSTVNACAGRTRSDKGTSSTPALEKGELTRSSILILVLVAVPLAVGAAATVIVSFNYYCNLC